MRFPLVVRLPVATVAIGTTQSDGLRLMHLFGIRMTGRARTTRTFSRRLFAGL